MDHLLFWPVGQLGLALIASVIEKGIKQEEEFSMKFVKKALKDINKMIGIYFQVLGMVTLFIKYLNLIDKIELQDFKKNQSYHLKCLVLENHPISSLI